MQVLNVKCVKGDRLVGTLKPTSGPSKSVKLLIFGPSGEKLKKIMINKKVSVSLPLPETGSYRLEFRRVPKKLKVNLKLVE